MRQKYAFIFRISVSLRHRKMRMDERLKYNIIIEVEKIVQNAANTYFN